MNISAKDLFAQHEQEKMCSSNQTLQICLEEYNAAEDELCELSMAIESLSQKEAQLTAILTAHERTPFSLEQLHDIIDPIYYELGIERDSGLSLESFSDDIDVSIEGVSEVSKKIGNAIIDAVGKYLLGVKRVRASIKDSVTAAAQHAKALSAKKPTDAKKVNLGGADSANLTIDGAIPKDPISAVSDIVKGYEAVQNFQTRYGEVWADMALEALTANMKSAPIDPETVIELHNVAMPTLPVKTTVTSKPRKFLWVITTKQHWDYHVTDEFVGAFRLTLETMGDTHKGFIGKLVGGRTRKLSHVIDRDSRLRSATVPAIDGEKAASAAAKLMSDLQKVIDRPMLDEAKYRKIAGLWLAAKAGGFAPYVGGYMASKASIAANAMTHVREESGQIAMRRQCVASIMALLGYAEACLK